LTQLQTGVLVIMMNVIEAAHSSAQWVNTSATNTQLTYKSEQ